jgi:hypothetical protein
MLGLDKSFPDLESTSKHHRHQSWIASTTLPKDKRNCPPSMSVSALAMLRPLCGHCLRQSPTALLSLRVQSRQASFTLRAVVALRPLEKRFQSTTHGSNSSDSASKSDTAGATGKEDAKQIPKPKITIRQFMGRALTVGLRNLIVGLSPRSIRQACRDSPGEMALVLSL